MASQRIQIRDLLDSNALGRAIAIVLIVMAHVKYADPYWWALSPFTSAGKLGVSIFVFYSGLLHQFQLRKAGDNFSIRDWSAKRLLRIYPTYWVGLALTLAFGVLFHARNYALSTIMANIVGIHLLIKEQTIGLAKSYWFISLILLCYLLFIVFRNVRRKGWLVIGSLVFSLLMIYLGNKGLLGDVHYHLPSLALPMFFWGMWLMDHLWKGGIIPGNQAIHWFLAIFLFAITALLFKSSHPAYISRTYWEMAGLICLNLSTIYICLCITYCFQWLRSRSTMLLRFLSWMGGLSFAIYCLHEPFLFLLEKTTGLGHPIARFLFYFVLILIMSWPLAVLNKKIMACCNFRSLPVVTLNSDSSS